MKCSGESGRRDVPAHTPAGPIQAVLFDLGGVLVESPFDAFDRYEEGHGLARGFIRSLNAANHHENAWARLERNEVDFDEFCRLFEAEARAAGGVVDARELFSMFGTGIRDEMVEAARRCRQVCKTGLLTNNFMRPPVSPGVDAGGARRLSEILMLFDAVVASSEAGIRKPDPRFYRLACQRLGVEPSRSVFLDDLGVNLKPARAMGMITIKVTDTASALDELEAVLGVPLR